MKFQLCYPGGKKKGLTFSYDDSHPDNLRLAGILNRHGMKATFNLNSVLLPGENEEQKADYVKHLLAGGHEIACHGLTHAFFGRMPQLSLVEEVLEDLRRLEKLSGRIVNRLAYPYRAYNAQVIETLRSLGIVYARAARSTGFFPLPADDTRTVRNPNAQSIWVADVKGIPHEIKGGTQTVFE